MGTDLFVPALPLLAQALAVDAGAAQFTLTTFFIGLAAGMLLWGPLSDRYGRKRVLCVGLAAMAAASLVAARVESVGAVAAARLMQGLAMSSGAVIARTVVRDLHAHEEAARLLASMTIVFSIVPIAAPLAGAAIAGLASHLLVLRRNRGAAAGSDALRAARDGAARTPIGSSGRNRTHLPRDPR